MGVGEAAPPDPEPGTVDRIQLRGLRVLGSHGVGAPERGSAQPFEVDLDLAMDLGPAGASDALADTCDYAEVLQRVARVVAEESFALLEALGEAIAAAALSDTRVKAVTVSLRKLRPPVPLDVTSVGVCITRHPAHHPPRSAELG
ncbi:MAG: dihydroneopterin aldolase [Acidimicrobiales bacterium]